MVKKNIKPQQKQPVIRYTTAKAINELTEENLAGQSLSQGAMPSSFFQQHINKFNNFLKHIRSQ